MEGKKPIKTYKAGLLSVNVWENETVTGSMKSFSFQRGYKDEKNDEWKNTQSLRLRDLPVLAILLDEVYKDECILEEEK